MSAGVLSANSFRTLCLLLQVLRVRGAREGGRELLAEVGEVLAVLRRGHRGREASSSDSTSFFGSRGLGRHRLGRRRLDGREPGCARGRRRRFLAAAAAARGAKPIAASENQDATQSSLRDGRATLCRRPRTGTTSAADQLAPSRRPRGRDAGGRRARRRPARTRRSARPPRRPCRVIVPALPEEVVELDGRSLRDRTTAPLEHLRAVAADDAAGHQRERDRLAASGAARGVDPLLPLGAVLDRGEHGVVLVGIARAEAAAAWPGGAADDQRRAAAAAPAGGVELSAHCRLTCLELLLEARPSARRRSGNGKPNASCSRSFQPAPSPSSTRPPETWSAVATTLASIDGPAEGDRRDHRPEPDALGHRGERGDRRPGIERPRVGSWKTDW